MSDHKFPKIDVLLLIGAVAIIGAIAYGFATGIWRWATYVVVVLLLLLCLRALIRDMSDEREVPDMSEAYDCNFSDPVEIKLICPKYTYGVDAFYVYCENQCIAKICRGKELLVKVPQGKINLGLIRVEGVVPRKYLLIDTDNDDVVYIYPDSNDRMLAYRLFAPRGEAPDEEVFRKYYAEQKKGSVHMSATILILMLIVALLVLVFFR